MPRHFHRPALSLILAALLCGFLAPAHAQPERPVRYGGKGDHARCGMAVVELGPDQPAPLRTAPHADARVLAQVNALVHICDASDDYHWLGVIVTPLDAGNGPACLPDPLPAVRQPYTGHCRSGWVEAGHFFLLEEG